MSCIGTAGHIDHGKSTLVTALTGIDPDRLAEEKARGMTIDLGFAWLTLPSGREASVVDVPGHEGFIKNMLAGVGGIDVALVVVAADEGVMPQTAEHLAILDLLRVRSGVVALTKADLVDAEWLELVREDLTEKLSPTTLAGAPIIACSAVTRQGLSELLAALDAALDNSPPRRDLGRPRLPIDRVFTITGFGTVTTGTLQDGVLRAGQEVEILPSGRRARIRGMQAHKQTVDRAVPGGRFALNLAGVAKEEVARGDVVTLPGMLRPTYAVDARLEVTRVAPRPVAHNAEVEVFAGAAEAPARLVLLDAEELRPGESGWAQLRLRRPLVVARGDRFIVRIPSPSLTIGGGAVAEPQARRHKRRDSAVLARLETLAQGDPEELVLAALRPGDGGAKASKVGGYGGREPGELVKAVGLTADDASAALEALLARGAALRIGSFVYATTEWDRLRADATRVLAEYHRQYPLRAGMPREEWRARLGLSMRQASDALVALATEGTAVETAGATNGSQPARGVFVKAADHEAHLAGAQERAAQVVLARFRATPFAPPTRAEVEASLGPEVTAYLVERGDLMKMSDAILLSREAYAEVLRRVVTHLRSHETLTVAEARDLLDTSRKYMLPIFEYLDHAHITRRIGDDRVLGPNAPVLTEAAAPDSPAVRG